MLRKTIVVVALLLTSACGATVLEGQDWRPPTRQMPLMPAMGELTGDWLAPRAAWFTGLGPIAGVEASALRARGEARRGTAQAQVVSFSDGPLPVVVWQDRNGDGRADLLEIYRGSGVIVQLIDADYDGQANVLRVYAADGTLIREERL
jgi:hypothetical protein